ncbi:hypothetical protein D3C76_663410 [compost metagenome]
MVLQVRPGQLGAAPDERPGFGGGHGHHTALVQQVGHHRRQQSEAAEVAVHRRLPRLQPPHHRHHQVILQIGADPGNMPPHGDAMTLQLSRRTDAGKHQQLRGNHRAGAEDHLAARLDAHPHTTVEIFDATGALSIEQHAGNPHPRSQHEIAAAGRRPQVGMGRRTAAHAGAGGLVVADAFLPGAVEVVGARNPGLLGGGDDRGAERGGRYQVGDRQRPVLAVPGTLQEQVALGAAEVRLDIRPAPARRRRGPVVVILALAAHVEQAVDRRAAAEHLAARQRDFPAAEFGLGVGFVGPVEAVPGPGGHAPAGGHVDQQAAVAFAGFQQQHAGRAVLGQARRQRTTRAAGADDDVVMAFHVRCSALRVR